jgi:hypothetical protein
LRAGSKRIGMTPLEPQSVYQSAVCAGADEAGAYGHADAQVFRFHS